MRTHESRFRVRYAETDQMGVVYHANYLVWMEIGRVEFYRAAGLTYRTMEQDGIMLAVVDVHCRFRAPARYDDEIAVETGIAEATPRMVRFRYEIRNAATGQRLATGETKHIFCNRDLKPARLPTKYRALFRGEKP